MSQDLVLHGYWRSTASYRVRIALNLKGLSYAQATHDLRRGEQSTPEYLSLAPQALVPALMVGTEPLTQSLAIMEWLEERFPLPTLLPTPPLERARVRAMAALIACDIHPLNNLRILTHLRQELGADEACIEAWISRWITEGFTALEAMVARHGGDFCHGASPGLADCCLVPQIYSAQRFGVELADFPTLSAINRRALTLEAFAKASPENQPDADVLG